VNRSLTRWLLLLGFPLGYLTLQQSVGTAGSNVLLLTVVNMAACGLLLSRLGGPPERALWAWLVLFLFLDGYFFRLYWIAHKLNSPTYINTKYSEVRWVTGDRILSSLSWVTLGFCVFCVVSTVSLTLAPGRVSNRSREAADRLVGPMVPIVVVTFLSLVLVIFVELSVGYGVLGQANPNLPLHLGTLLTLFGRFLGPAMLLLGVWVFDGRRSKWANITAGLILLLGIMDSLASTSRGSIILLSLPLFFLWGLTGRFSTGRRVAAVALAILAVGLYPFLSSLRLEKIDPAAPASRAPLSLSGALESGANLASRVGDGGIDGVWFTMDTPGRLSSRSLTYLRPGALVEYYTRSVVRVSAANDFRSPGTFAALIILGGGAGVALVGGLLFAAIGVGWQLLRRLRTWPVALALAANAIASFVGAGALDFLLFVKLGLQVILCELIYRKLLRSSQVPGLPDDLRGAIAKRPQPLDAGGRPTPLVASDDTGRLASRYGR